MGPRQARTIRVSRPPTQCEKQRFAPAKAGLIPRKGKTFRALPGRVQAFRPEKAVRVRGRALAFGRRARRPVGWRYARRTDRGPVRHRGLAAACVARAGGLPGRTHNPRARSRPPRSKHRRTPTKRSPHAFRGACAGSLPIQKVPMRAKEPIQRTGSTNWLFACACVKISSALRARSSGEGRFFSKMSGSQPTRSVRRKRPRCRRAGRRALAANSGRGLDRLRVLSRSVR